MNITYDSVKNAIAPLLSNKIVQFVGAASLACLIGYLLGCYSSQTTSAAQLTALTTAHDAEMADVRQAIAKADADARAAQEKYEAKLRETQALYESAKRDLEARDAKLTAIYTKQYAGKPSLITQKIGELYGLKVEEAK